MYSKTCNVSMRYFLIFVLFCPFLSRSYPIFPNGTKITGQKRTKKDKKHRGPPPVQYSTCILLYYKVNQSAHCHLLSHAAVADNRAHLLQRNTHSCRFIHVNLSMTVAYSQKPFHLKYYLYFNFNYLTRYIYIRYNSGDLNDVGTKIWGFCPKTAKFRTPN